VSESNGDWLCIGDINRQVKAITVLILESLAYKLCKIKPVLRGHLWDKENSVL
jgi:hypothetical protein